MSKEAKNFAPDGQDVNEATEAKTTREKSEAEQKTSLFKEHLQAIVLNRTGKKVSKETAWSLFKDIIFGTAQFVVLTEGDPVLSLSGVGRFEVIPAVARGSKKEEGKVHTPKYRFYPSVTVNSFVETAFGETEMPSDLKGIGLFDTEEFLDTLSSARVVNAQWLKNQPVPGTEVSKEDK